MSMTGPSGFVGVRAAFSSQLTELLEEAWHFENDRRSAAGAPKLSMTGFLEHFGGDAAKKAYGRIQTAGKKPWGPVVGEGALNGLISSTLKDRVDETELEKFLLEYTYRYALLPKTEAELKQKTKLVDEMADALLTPEFKSSTRSIEEFYGTFINAQLELRNENKSSKALENIIFARYAVLRQLKLIKGNRGLEAYGNRFVGILNHVGGILAAENNDIFWFSEFINGLFANYDNKNLQVLFGANHLHAISATMEWHWRRGQWQKGPKDVSAGMVEYSNHFREATEVWREQVDEESFLNIRAASEICFGVGFGRTWHSYNVREFIEIAEEGFAAWPILQAFREEEMARRKNFWDPSESTVFGNARSIERLIEFHERKGIGSRDKVERLVGLWMALGYVSLVDGCGLPGVTAVKCVSEALSLLQGSKTRAYGAWCDWYLLCGEMLKKRGLRAASEAWRHARTLARKLGATEKERYADKMFTAHFESQPEFLDNVPGVEKEIVGFLLKEPPCFEEQGKG